MAEISKRKAFIFSICLSFLSVLLFLLASEAYLTIRYNKERARIESAHGSSDFCTKVSESPELLYTLVPDKCDANSHGFRDYDYAYSKGEGDFRIVIIGDSVAMGQFVNIGDSFAKVLERKLNAIPGRAGRKVEVIVLAQSGYSTSQELFLLENEAFRYSPDLIIWSYVLNDPASPIYHDSNGDLGRYYFKPAFRTASFVAKKLFQIRERRRADDCETEYHAMLHCVYWSQVESEIGEISQISQESGIPIIFVIHPLFEENGTFENYWMMSVHTRLASAASGVGLPVIDILNAYKAYDPQELTIPTLHAYDSLHPNEKGHRVAADYLFGVIRENKKFQEWILAKD
jgi:lysophospholipase L1-like esterase